MKTITGSDESLPKILGSDEQVQAIIDATIREGFCEDAERVREALKRLEISFSAYEKHRARNVYNSAYSNWWEVAGHSWYNHLQTTVGVIGLGSVGEAAFPPFQSTFTPSVLTLMVVEIGMKSSRQMWLLFAFLPMELQINNWMSLVCCKLQRN